VVAFNGLSENCANFLEKGRLVAVVGRVQTREYEDREGTKHQVMQVVAEKVTFLGAARREDGAAPLRPGEPASPSESNSHEVPF
jgi:single-strand DNA-binding protein